MSSNTYFLLAKICICALPVFCVIFMVCNQFAIGKYDLSKLPKVFRGWIERMIWGSLYIVRVNDIWMVARGWETGDGNLSIVFEPYKNNVIDFKAGEIYDVLPGDWRSVPLSWSQDRINDEIIKRNIQSLKCKHPKDKYFERQHGPAEFPFQDLSRQEVEQMTPEQIEREVRQRLYARFHNDEDFILRMD